MIDPAELRAAIFRCQLANFLMRLEFLTLTGPEVLIGREPVLDESTFEVCLVPITGGSALPARICADMVISAGPVDQPARAA